MSSYNFADRYKSAGLAPGHEIIALRQAPFDKLKKDASLDVILDLTRLYFGLPVPQGANWFREAFAETDLSFSLVDNEREASVLSACLLAAIIDDGQIFAALAPLVTAAGGARRPLSCPDFLEEARQALGRHAVESREDSAADVTKIRLPIKGKAVTALEAIVEAQDWGKFSDVMKGTSAEALEATKTLANQVFSVVQPLAAQVRDLREEVSMLWWYIGGWSRTLEKPFAELDVATAALMAGLDLAQLVDGDCGPSAAPAILHRLVIGSRAEIVEKLTLNEAVDSLPIGTLSSMGVPSGISKIGDICVVYSALTKADEIGSGGAWHASFKRATGVDATISFSPLQLAIQMYRESLLAAQIK